MKRPKDMTDDEIRALPIGAYEEILIPLTEEDYAKGMVGKHRVVHKPRDVAAVGYFPDDIFAWKDPQTGEVWRFGALADGGWYRERFLVIFRA